MEFVYVWHTLRRLGTSYPDLPDLTHDVFIIAWRKRADYDPERALRPWLFGIAFRVCARHRRRRWLLRLAGLEREPADPAPSPAEQLEELQQRAQLQRALAGVSVKLRPVLLMHDLDEQSMPGIAAALELPVKTAYSRLRLGREQLLRALRKLQQLCRYRRRR